MNFTPQEQAILNVFERTRSPTLRFEQIARAALAAPERTTAARSLGSSAPR